MTKDQHERHDPNEGNCLEEIKSRCFTFKQPLRNLQLAIVTCKKPFLAKYIKNSWSLLSSCPCIILNSQACTERNQVLTGEFFAHTANTTLT